MKPISIVVLTEDSGEQACEVLQELIKKMLYLVDPAAPVYDRKRIHFRPTEPTERQNFRGNHWQSLAQRQKRIDLLQYIQSQLRRPDVEGFVIIHVDGDRPYRQSDQGVTSHNQQQCEKLLISHLRTSLQDRPDLLEKFLLVVPFYSIEAWLYQNTETALSLYEQHYRTHTHDMQQFEEWQKSPETLDEVMQPKQAVSLADRFNRELATQGFPAQRVYEVGKSFYRSVERLRSCTPLVAALQAFNA